MYRTRLDALASRSLLRRLRTIESAPGAEVELEGRRVLLFSSNNYLDLAAHPRITEAAINAIRRYGVGAGASRLVSGSLRPHRELEERLAAFKRVEATLVFTTGYQANLGLIPTLAEERAVIYADRLCHASLIDACRLCEIPLRIYRHRDHMYLSRLLQKGHASALVVTEGVFSMDGDVAPLPDLYKAVEHSASTLVVDDAHGTGIMGKTGRGTVEHWGLEGRPIVQMGTLSKALGGLGGFVAGSRDLIDYLVNRARPFIYTTALPPALAAAAIAALDVIEGEPERRARLWSLRHRLHEGIRQLGFATLDSQSPIIPLLVGDADAACSLSEALLTHGIYAPAIRPPTVPAGTSRIRMSVTAGHRPEQIDYALETLRKICASDPSLIERLTSGREIGRMKGRKTRSTIP
ncbi:MAG TPA: 8-amino-7-oxononanoate synthase [Candidatus Binatia bacterium]|jgi:8-amino-7-oxononanoate synthase|nr:8-amino-7-oxononanoate synthase [Candidatus Binatia bacterium]